MKRKNLFKTNEEVIRLNEILCDSIKKALTEIKFNYKDVYAGYQVGYDKTSNKVEYASYEYFKAYINEAKSDRTFFLTVDMYEIEKKGFYRKLKRSLKVLTKGIDLR